MYNPRGIPSTPHTVSPELDFMSGSIHLFATRQGCYEVRSYWFGDNVSAATGWARAASHTGYDVYFAANLTRAPTRGEPTRGRIVRVRYCFVEVAVPFSEAGVRRKVSSVPPSVEIWSGDAWQLLWRVKDASVEDCERVNRGLARALGGHEYCTNSDRLFHLPGTINYRAARRAELLWHHDVSYSASELLTLFQEQ